MGKNSFKKNRLAFIRTLLNATINVLFTVVCCLLFGTIYFFIHRLFSFVLKFEGYLGDVISVATSLLIFVLSLVKSIQTSLTYFLNRAKQRIYIFLCTQPIRILERGVLNFNRSHWQRKPGQEHIITQGVKILHNRNQGVFAIESPACQGKTTTAMLLLDFIGRNLEQLDLFISLKDKILYFDGFTDYESTQDFLSNPEFLSDSVLIIDNIHKLTSSKLALIVEKAVLAGNFMAELDKGCLVLLLYQTSLGRSPLINELGKSGNLEFNHCFKLDGSEPIDLFSNHTEIFPPDFSKSFQSDDLQILEQHIRYLIHTDKHRHFLPFIKSVYGNRSIDRKNRPFAKLMAAIVLIASFQGYVYRSDLKRIVRNTPELWIVWRKNIAKMKKSGLLIEFPLLKSTYIFNEKVAKCYKQLLFSNSEYETIYENFAMETFQEESSESPQKWLYLIECGNEYIRTVPYTERKKYLYSSLAEYSISYLLDILEAELFIIPSKKQTFCIELGTLYIHNGQWKAAREILKPLVPYQSDQEDAWLLQLKIIEADHGTDDDENICMLEEIRKNSTNIFTQFLSSYWKYHIHMEHGSFSLAQIEELVQIIKQHPEWKSHEYYDNTLRKLGSDRARTYFLQGLTDYNNFRELLDLCAPPFIRQLTSDIATQIKLLTQAHYVHYDVVFQLGIWGNYELGKVDPSFRGSNLQSVVICALQSYDECIEAYQHGGDKKWRTVQIRRDELSLCSDSHNFVEILGRLDDFWDYSDINNISVFKGYGDTLRGKTYALYAVTLLDQGDNYNHYISRSLDSLKNARKYYMAYKNLYGIMRTDLLSILVEMLKKRSDTNLQERNNFEMLFCPKIHNILELCEEKDWRREIHVCEYLLENIRQYNTIVRLLKFYPIVLQ